MNVNNSPSRTTVRSKLGFFRLAGLLGAAQRRFRRSRSGSVLILVVALLVLLALIGTAFITTAGNERDAAVQHIYTTQIELLVQAVKDLAVTQIVDKVVPLDPATPGTGAFRAATVTTPAVAAPPTVTLANIPPYFTNVDFAGWDAWIADRYPTPLYGSAFTGKPPAGTPAIAPVWTYITANPLATNRDPANPNHFPGQFRSPYSDPTNSNIIDSYNTRFALIPDAMPIVGPGGATRLYPALRIFDPTEPALRDKKALAGDADGDGIADSGLIELPMSMINGVKFYASMRIIDNSAAINASVAWENMPSIQGGPINDERDRLPINSYPSNLELSRFLTATDGTAGVDAFNRYRFSNATPIASVRPYGEAGALTTFQYAHRYEAFWNALGSRLDNPGDNEDRIAYRALGTGESASLAYRFTLASPQGRQGILDQYVPVAMGHGGGQIGAAVNRQPYRPDQSLNWFNGIFDYISLTDATAPKRAMLVGHNSTSNFVPAFSNPTGFVASTSTTIVEDERQRAGQYRYRGVWSATEAYRIGEWVNFNGFSYVCIANHQGVWTVPGAPTVLQPGTADGLMAWAEVPWGSHPVRVNPNTATFGQLLAAYYAVMGNGPETSLDPTLLDAAYGGDQVWNFGNVLRPVDGGTSATLTPRNMKQLRAAIAAINTIDLRDGDDTVSSQTIVLADENGQNPTKVHVHGMERQPYITEALVHISKENVPYVVVELFNPYPVAMPLDAFRLVIRGRAAPGTVMTLAGSLAGQSIPPLGYLYVESAEADRPTDLMTAIPAPVIAMPPLKDLVDRNSEVNELLLLRTRRMDGTATQSTNKFNEFNEGGDNFSDFVPADQLEFLGMATGTNVVTDPGSGMATPVSDRYHYRRANRVAPDTNVWHCVYGGPYKRSAGNSAERRQQGWVRDQRPDPMAPTVDRLTLPGFGPKSHGLDGTVHNDGVYSPSVGTFRTRSLQVASYGMPGPWGENAPGTVAAPPAASPQPSLTAPVSPVGGFPRNGDLLQVTFVGRYTVEGAFREMNSISMDSAFAEDGDKSDDDESNGSGNGSPVEQLGRFCPIVRGSINDLEGRPDPAVANAQHRYAWATDLFDYLSVISPQDDYLPNVDPFRGVGGAALEPVANGLEITKSANANRGREDTASIQGLVNLNTASWRVIAQLPFTSDPVTNENIAWAIMQHREKNGPFRNLFDLHKVAGFQDALGATATFNPLPHHGDITPLPLNATASGDDEVIGDFEARYLMINRISNMVSFRSDSFTVYVLVQGWRNPGTKQPELVVQRRAALIVDRSTLKPNRQSTTTFGSPRLTIVPQN